VVGALGVDVGTEEDVVIGVAAGEEDAELFEAAGFREEVELDGEAVRPRRVGGHPTVGRPEGRPLLL
jgi:hypothetical protein